ncbi:MAG: molybdenum ABC transporter ATP-binding protein [Paracoccaceae bacterium]
MIEVSLHHRFPGFALEVAFTAPGGVTALFGRSGTGKSTVVNAVAGLLRPDRGRIAVDGRVLSDTATRTFVPPHRRRIGYVFQDARLFPHLTVRQNLTYGRFFAPKGGPGLEEITDLLGIGALLARRPGALSGGERQRVAIGRALLSNPRLLLMDEPLAALDEARKAEILPFLERMRDATRVPILYVSHSVAEVARLATTVVLLDGGRVLCTGPVAQVLADPAATPALTPREAGALLVATVEEAEGDGLTRLSSPGGPLFLPGVEAPPGTRLRLRIPAQEVILSRERPQGLSALNILSGTVAEVVEEGGNAMVRIAMADQSLLARVTRRSVAALNLAPGAAVHAIVKSVALADRG